ncbi:peptidyl-prolyl cis-trans isomerase, cyclophilin-type [Ostertagia ostertagi]
MSVTLHTTAGDIKLELFCQECPKACENFLALCASGYYKDNIFHRNIKDFMVQTGDPTGTGKGGNSIWGGPFEDELSVELRQLLLFDAKRRIRRTAAKIKQSQDYFNQYIEEYYEEDDEEIIPPVKPEKIKEEIRVELTTLFFSFKKESVCGDIVSSHFGRRLDPGTWNDVLLFWLFQVICSPFNARHGIAVAEVLRKAGKLTDEQPRKLTIRHSFGWFQIELGRIQVKCLALRTDAVKDTFLD